MPSRGRERRRPVVDADRGAAENVAQEINQAGDAAAVVAAADVSRSADVRRYVAQAAARGPIDAVVHAAGIAGPAPPLPEFDEAEFDRVMAVNARGTFLGMRYPLPHMRDGSAIVDVASVSGMAGYPMVAAYVASKHAVVGLTRTAALEGASRRIRVNAICPGPIEGRLMAAAADGASFAPEDDPFLRGVPTALPALPALGLVTLIACSLIALSLPLRSGPRSDSPRQMTTDPRPYERRAGHGATLANRPNFGECPSLPRARPTVSARTRRPRIRS